jgi:rare lipoprotein A
MRARRLLLLSTAALLLAACASTTGGSPEAAVAMPDESAALLARGQASWYGAKFHGRRTASGEVFDMNGLTAAHRDYPFGTRLRVRSVATGREVVVRVNDRGPSIRSRIIDLSQAAADALGVRRLGVFEVELLRE